VTTVVDDVLAGGWFAAGAGLGAAVVAVRRVDAWSSRRPPVTPPLLPVVLSLNAVGWLYASTPDTELARFLIGAVLAAGAGARTLGQSWRLPAAAVTVAVAAAAFADGRTRTSAVVGGIGIAAVHAVVQRWGPGRPRPQLLGLAVWASAVCARSAGAGPGLARPLAVAAVALAVVVVWTVAVPAWRARHH